MSLKTLVSVNIYAIVSLALPWVAAADDSTKTSPIAMRVLIAALSDSDPEVVLGALTVLANQGPEAKEATAPMLKTLKHPKHNIRWMACHALGRLGPGAPEVVGPLIKMTEDPHWNVRIAAARALVAIDTSNNAIMVALTDLLNDPSRDVRWVATHCLGEMEITTQAVEMALRSRLEDDDESVRRESRSVLRRLQKLSRL